MSFKNKLYIIDPDIFPVVKNKERKDTFQFVFLTDWKEYTTFQYTWIFVQSGIIFKTFGPSNMQTTR